MRKLTQEEFEEVLRQHSKWMNGHGGECANFYDTDLSDIVFQGLTLFGVSFYGAKFSYEALAGAKLKEIDLPLEGRSVTIRDYLTDRVGKLGGSMNYDNFMILLDSYAQTDK